MFRRQTSLLIIICLGHVLLISAQVQSKSGLPLIQSLAVGAFVNFQSATDTVAGGGHGLWTNYFALRGAARENSDLRAHILDLEGQLQGVRADAARAHALEETLALKQAQPAPTLTARVIAGSPVPGILTATIDRGADDGVAADMAVIAARGVVGRVIAPISAHAATVQLLTGRNANTAVVFERSNAGGIVSGSGTTAVLHAEYVPVLADVQPGERVTTSGQDGVYPPGFLVGAVERVTRGGGDDRDIAIRPAVDFSHIDIVLVMLARPPRPDGSRP